MTDKSEPVNISKLNDKLDTLYKGAVKAHIDGAKLCLEGELDNWDDIVRAGRTAARFSARFSEKSGGKAKYHVINDISLIGVQIPPMKMPRISDSALDGESPDVLVIGGGVVGCAIARELTRYDCDVLLVEKEHDVAMHASSRNDGMVHPGVDLRPGLVKKHYNDRGNLMYPQLCRELGMAFRYVGQYVCFTDAYVTPVVRASLAYWKYMKMPAEYVGHKELKEREPNLSDNVKCALFFPNAGIVCPYGLTIALAENAVSNGARISLDTAVTEMEIENGVIKSVLTNRGRVYPRLVINAAGVFSEDIAKMAGDRYFSIHPRRGTNMILDKKTAKAVKSVAAPLSLSSNKATHSKGGGVVSTIDGNLLVGPDAHETYFKENFETNRESITKMMAKQRQVTQMISERDIITYFTGIRAATYEEDFYIAFGKDTRNVIHAAGIQSPGLTAAPAIAQDVSKWAAEYLGAGANAEFSPVREPIVRMAELAPREREAKILDNPDYGIIVCRCEEVSRGEVLDALRRSVPCDTVDGVKRRVRPGMGRCQGGFCGPLILQIIAEELGVAMDKVCKGDAGSEILMGDTK